MTLIIDRSYLERNYIEFLRHQYPDPQKFEQFVEQQVTQYGYQLGEDHTKKLYHDVQTCLLNKLDIPSIITLSRTCKRWLNVIHNHSYDDYWRSRVRHADYLPTGKMPDSILWFDIFQYVWCQNSHSRTQGTPFNRRTFSGFMQAKYKTKTRRNYPDITRLRIMYEYFSVDLLPEKMRALLSNTMFRYVNPDNTTMICRLDRTEIYCKKFIIIINIFIINNKS